MFRAVGELPKNSLTFLQRLPLARSRPWIGYGVAIVASLAGLLTRWGVGAALPAGFPYITFFPPVILTAFFFGVRPGALAAILCGLLSWYFFIPPLESFALDYRAIVALAFFTLIVVVDIALVHWMQLANARLALAEKRSAELAGTREMLFQELQHRVGNNLQMMSAILQLQERRLKDDTAKFALSEASRRLGLVGRLQRTLYKSDGAQLSLGNYIDRIVRDTLGVSGREDILYSFDAQASGVLPSENAVPTALVVAEAISNTIEHAYDEQGGPLEVTVVENDDDCYVICIQDEGKGLPDGFELKNANSLGLRIAVSLARGLGGEFTLDNREDGKGAIARLVIPMSKEGNPDAAA
ncbi:sensor histidine kinase [Aurantiacibacter poecillastricola]|uniref:sensor histidine kinase n=1 Tax=Aurantiacibacter poecillastricola TaxID=3064385 RepID=UPI00273E7AFB|nr:histidine kinase dimerization/phosphoacceptor domain -containing protein [Aurantiacibacter sp. 219JJ12-13]MDP5263001.1 histidine kinase dimerization/phosphoacceptor domain -containing protein [Aurantiacibacter sp. 219JJ12-13]